MTLFAAGPSPAAALDGLDQVEAVWRAQLATFAVA